MHWSAWFVLFRMFRKHKWDVVVVMKMFLYVSAVQELFLNAIVLGFLSRRAHHVNLINESDVTGIY